MGKVKNGGRKKKKFTAPSQGGEESGEGGSNLIL
jgi:hypothetical protein